MDELLQNGNVPQILVVLTSSIPHLDEIGIKVMRAHHDGKIIGRAHRDKLVEADHLRDTVAQIQTHHHAHKSLFVRNNRLHYTKEQHKTHYDCKRRTTSDSTESGGSE